MSKIKVTCKESVLKEQGLSAKMHKTKQLYSLLVKLLETSHSRPWFLKLRYAYHCLLVRGLDKNRNIKRTKIVNNKQKHKPHIFANKQHCCQRYITQPRC